MRQFTLGIILGSALTGTVAGAITFMTPMASRMRQPAAFSSSTTSGSGNSGSTSMPCAGIRSGSKPIRVRGNDDRDVR